MLPIMNQTGKNKVKTFFEIVCFDSAKNILINTNKVHAIMNISLKTEIYVVSNVRSKCN